ncbi:MAG: 16S rRNA (uracil(1498)-N(3))-methyltransferase [Nitrosomonadales bacterium]|nr:16S rRNA (uracil(1498)-N(3))-methyltransferase [Nitrosomonadales bacterium]
MPAPRFYCPPPLPGGTRFELPREAAQHAHRVLRLRVNDPVQVFDGEGGAFDARIDEIGGKRVVLHELQTCMAEAESPLRITLAQAMCGSEKMDWVVQKATELGVAEIRPVQAQRSVARLSSERAEKRVLHWRNVAIAACEQCGRNLLPQIHFPLEFGAWLEAMRDAPGARLLLMPEGATALREQPQPQAAATLLVGPEGGFSADEVRVAQRAGFTPIRLGANILRTETAAIAGIAALQTLWGDFR